jgi:DsbC/DsbD-like thiol-disulfide interchange protein
MKTALIARLLTLLTLVSPALAADQDLCTAQILADVSAITPGKPLTVGVKLKLAPGYHVYWINPGDTGIATKITFTLPDGFPAGEVQFPIPRKFEMPGGITAFGYEGDVMFLATITPPGDLKEGTDVTIGAKASWLVCDKDRCVQGGQDVALKLAVNAAMAPFGSEPQGRRQAANADEFEKWRAQLPQKADDVSQDIKVDAPNGAFKSASGQVTMNWKQTPEKVEWFPAPPDQLMVSSSDVKTDGSKSIVTFKIDALPGEKVINPSIFSVLVYTVNGQRHGVAVPIDLHASK